MKPFRIVASLGALILALAWPTMGATQERRVQGFDAELRHENISWEIALVLTPAAEGKFTATGYMSMPLGGNRREATPIEGTMTAEGALSCFGAGDSLTKGAPAFLGRWDKAEKTVVITTFAFKAYQISMHPRAEDGRRLAPWFPYMGSYEQVQGPIKFTLRQSKVPDQATVTGAYTYPNGARVELRGTYWFRRNEITCFGDYRGNNENHNITLDGPFVDNREFNLTYRIKNIKTGKIEKEQEGFFRWVGPETFDVDIPDRDDKPTPKPKGKLDGTIKIEKGSIDIGEKVKLTLKSSVTERDEVEVTESVALYGPDDKLITRIDKPRTVFKEPATREFNIVCDEEGTYTVRSQIKGEETDEWKDSVTFQVKRKDGAAKADGGGTDKPKTAEGSFGLIKKVVAKAPPPEPNPFQGYTMSAQVSEGSLTVSMTPTGNAFSGYDLSMSWGSPPSTLKPGQIVELACSASGTRSERDPPGVEGSAWFLSSGFEVLEQKMAVAAFPANNIFSAKDSGKYKFKVPEKASGGELMIQQGFTGPSFGVGGFGRPCTYTYKWNADPIKDDPEKDKEAEKEDDPKSTSLTQVTPDDPPKKLTARLDPTEITLRAGEPSRIVSLTIGGFRTNTSDRVEVVFPQGTDNWISLPGQIVSSSGSGNYDPSNMNRPENMDGYFFAARSTAPSGKTQIIMVVRQKGAGEVRLTLDVTVIGRERVASDPDNSGGDPWSGTWKGGLTSAWRPLVLKKEGDRITGTFCDGEAKIKGTVSGNKFIFTFENYIGVNGSGEFTLKTDGSLEGWYFEDGDEKKTKYLVYIKRE